MQTAGSIEDHDIASSAFGGLICIKGDGGGVGSVVASDDVDLELIGPGDSVVATAEADDEGHYIFDYQHKGKPTEYTVNLYEGATQVASAVVILQGNGWWEVSFTATDCGDEILELWTSSVMYGSGRYKKK